MRNHTTSNSRLSSHSAEIPSSLLTHPEFSTAETLRRAPNYLALQALTNDAPPNTRIAGCVKNTEKKNPWVRF